MEDPKKNEDWKITKKQVIRFRVTSLEKAIIEKKAENSGLSVSSFCRNTALGRKIGYRLTDEEIEIYKDLAKFRADFVRLSNYFNKRDVALSKEARSLADSLQRHLNKFK